MRLKHSPDRRIPCELAPLEGPRVKVARASEIVAHLRSEVETWSATNPFELYEDTEPDGTAVIRARILQPPQPRWGALVGDIIHNLRTALDLLAWQLVLANGQQPDRDTAFPIAANAQAFRGKLNRGLGKASPRVQRAVELLRPWHGGNETLWALHTLDIEDKHRLLMPLMATQAETGLRYDFTRLGAPPAVSGAMGPVWMKLAEPDFPVVDGTVLFRNQREAAGHISELHFKLELALDAAPVRARPIAGVLDEFGVAVEQVVTMIGRRCLN